MKIKEYYTRKELRSIYKDAKYNWSKNISIPLDLASNENNTIYLGKVNGDIKLYLNSNGELKYTDVVIHSFNQFIKFYEALIKLFR